MASKDHHSMSVRYQSFGSVPKITKTVSGGGHRSRLFSCIDSSISLFAARGRHAPCMLQMSEGDIPMRMESYTLLLDVGSLAVAVGMA